MNFWESHYGSIQKHNKKAINPRKLPSISARGIPPANELEEHLKHRVRIDPSKFIK